MAATLNVTPREGSGKGVARKLRQQGRVPAVVYGHGDRPEALSVDAHDLELLLAHANVGNTVVSLVRDGGPRSDALIRAVQMHPYKAEVLHVDFFSLHAGEVLRITVPVRLTGTPRGVVDEGGVLDHVLYAIEVEVLPSAIPEYAEADISGLGIGESARVHDIRFPGGGEVKVLTDGDLAVASVLQPTVHEAPAPGDEPAPEPALVRTRGDEEA